MLRLLAASVYSAMPGIASLRYYVADTDLVFIMTWESCNFIYCCVCLFCFYSLIAEIN